MRRCKLCGHSNARVRTLCASRRETLAHTRDRWVCYAYKVWLRRCPYCTRGLVVSKDGMGDRAGGAGQEAQRDSEPRVSGVCPCAAAPLALKRRCCCIGTFLASQTPTVEACRRRFLSIKSPSAPKPTGAYGTVRDPNSPPTHTQGAVPSSTSRTLPLTR